MTDAGGGAEPHSGAEPSEHCHSKEPTPTTPPPRPDPSNDPELAFQARTPPPLHAARPTPPSHDLFKMSPIAALKLLSAGVEALVRITGDIPPTPPPSNPTYPNMSGMQREKAEIVRSYSSRSLAQMGDGADDSGTAPAGQQKAQPQGDYFGQAAVQDDAHCAQNPEGNEPVDGVQMRHAPDTTTPPTFSDDQPTSAAAAPYVVVGANMQPLNLQHSAITRKFYSKRPPPISIEEYLMRMHRFCPMSTAVYLATSLYISRLAIDERAIPVTRRNAHRLLLAGLRVAMKALEDLSYPHSRVARVGGVSEPELARLEISFCFLAGFELVVREETLRSHWESLRKGGVGGAATGPAAATPVLRLDPARRRNVETAGAG